MSKLVGASFIALGTGGIALALLKDTKYDPLIRLGITKPKIISKIQQDFHCEVLFLKIITNYYATFEINKQINAITTPPEGVNWALSGGYQLDDDSKKRVADLQAQHDKAQKLYEDALKEYQASICGVELDIYSCVNNNGSCEKTTQFSADCVNNAIPYFDKLNFINQTEKDLSDLTEAQYKNKYGYTKAFSSQRLQNDKADLQNLKKAYDTCDIANVDCVTLKENINTLTEQFNRTKVKDSKLDVLQDVFNKTSCGTKQLVRTGVSYRDVRDCVKLDESIKAYKDAIAYKEKKKLQLGIHWLPYMETGLQNMKSQVASDEQDFITKGCKGRLESEKLKDNAITLTDLASQQEGSILKKNVTEQYAYIGIGALVLLTGFYMVLKK